MRSQTGDRGGTEWALWRGGQLEAAETTLARAKKVARHYHGIPLTSWKPEPLACRLVREVSR
jgi:hypothetical protein